MAGVTSVSLDGDDNDRVVVMGDNVNTVSLANQLNKKFPRITIVSVQKVKKPEEKKPTSTSTCCGVVCINHPPPAPPLPRELLCSKCRGKCEHCSKCHSHKRHCKCVSVIICSKCRSSKCDGNCAICFKCHSPRCSGQCCSPTPHPLPYYYIPRQCPPWCTCPRCYYVPPYDPPSHDDPSTYRVVYDSYNDGSGCSIM